jgi:plasmid stabilization system protein ParE
VKPIKWSKQARRDIERIADFMPSEIYPEIAAGIVAAARFVAATPKAGPLVGKGVDRKWQVKRFPFLLIYRSTSQDIWISRVIHVRSDWQQFL